MYLLTAGHTFSEEIKKSRFIAHAVPIKSAAEALEQVQVLSEADATHNCWAYRLQGDYRFNDDGEPGGTAGRPILQAIDGHDLMNTLVLVIRYFGGIKLGTGGLVRAYAGVASKCLDQAQKLPYVPHRQVVCACGFSDLGRLKSKLADCQILAEEFNATGVLLTLFIPVHLYEEVAQMYIGLTRGQGSWQLL